MRAVCLALALLLAGCAGEGGEAEPDAFKDLDATKETGVIRGVVVDQAINPIQGAKIAATPGGLETLSDATGSFGFSGLEPGVYFLTVSAPYHTSVQTSAEVKAGVDKPPVLRVAIQSLPKPVPAIQSLEWRFFMDGSVAALERAVVAGGFLGQGSFGKRLEIADNASWVQSELIWDAAQPLASDMLLQTRLYEPGSNDDFTGTQSAAGTSPLIHAWSNSTETDRADRIGYTLFVWTGTYPAGFTIAQDVYLFTHVFQHFTPDEGWQFGRDGAHAVPPPP